MQQRSDLLESHYRVNSFTGATGTHVGKSNDGDWQEVMLHYIILLNLKCLFIFSVLTEKELIMSIIGRDCSCQCW